MQKLESTNYTLESVENYKKYTKDAESVREDVKELQLQYLLAGYQIDPTHVYNAWFQFCNSVKSPTWMPVTSTYDVPVLCKPFVRVVK